MAPVIETRGANGTDGASVAHIVRISDIRRLGAWQRVGGRTATRGSLAIARRHAMRMAVAQASVVRPQVIAAASDLAAADLAIASGAICMRATRTVSSMDPAAWSRILCAAAA